MANAKETTISQLPRKALEPTDILIITSQNEVTSSISAQDLSDQIADLVHDSVIAEALAVAESTGYEEKGSWDASTNTPVLTANAAVGQSGTRFQRYVITTPGTLPFAIKGQAAGTAISYGYLVQGPDNIWFYDPKDTLALQKVTAIEPKVPGIMPFAESFNNKQVIAKSTNGKDLGWFSPDGHFHAYLEIENFMIPSGLKTKRVAWYGTSIPGEREGDISYPTLVAQAFGATLIQRSVPGSTIIFYGPSGTPGQPGYDAGQLGLSGTAYEHTHAGPYSDVNSFDRLIGDVISGPNPPDLIVLDHGFNDRPLLPSRLGTVDSLDKGTLAGSYNSIIAGIIAVLPKIRIVIACPYTKYQNLGLSTEAATTAQFESMRNMQKLVADKHGYPFFDFMAVAGASRNVMANTFYTYDGTHPNQEYKYILARLWYRFLLNNF